MDLHSVVMVLICVFPVYRVQTDSYMNLTSYEFPNGLSEDEGGKFIVGGSDHKFQTVEIEVF